MRLPDTLRRIAWEVAMTSIVPTPRRQAFLRRLGLRQSDGACLGQDLAIPAPERVSIGSGSFINRDVMIDVDTTIGRNVFIGPRATIVTGEHPTGPAHQRAADGAPSPVTIGDGTWIGAGAIILPGVTIGPGCVIGAGAVVTKDCAANGLYLGVPARRLKDLDPDGDPA